MAGAVDFSPGGYRFLPSVFQYSAGVAALPGHAIAYAEPVGQAHVRARFRAGDGAMINAIAFRAVGQKLGDALLNNRGQPVHVAGCLAVDRWQGQERLQMRIIDIALADPVKRMGVA